MLFMIIENFKNGDAAAVGARFQARGRMLPEGVYYHASWVDQAGARCFQVMEASDRVQLDPWLKAWSDLADFEVVPVLTSNDFWAGRLGR